MQNRLRWLTACWCLLAASACGPASDLRYAYETVTVDASADGLRLTVRRFLTRFDTPIRLNGKPSYVFSHRTWRVDGTVAEATAYDRCDVTPVSAPMPAGGALWLEGQVRTSCEDSGPFTFAEGRSRRLLLKDDVIVQRFTDVAASALGRRPDGSPVYAVQATDGGVSVVFEADGGLVTQAVPELGFMPDAGFDTPVSPRLVLSTGPTFAVASNKGLVAFAWTNTLVWAGQGAAVDAGVGEPLALWASPAGQKVVLRVPVPFQSYALDDVLVEGGARRVLWSSGFAGDRYLERSAATFDAAGTLYYLHETATGFRLSWGAGTLDLPVPPGARVEAQWVRVVGDRVHVGWTEARKATPPTLDLRTIALENGTVVWDRRVSLSDLDPIASPALGEPGSPSANQ